MLTWARLALALGAFGLLTACGHRPSQSVDGVRAPDVERGRALASSRGCGACHVINGVKDADGIIGPPLTHVAQRSFIAGVLSNTPQHLQQWIRHPQFVKPGVAMPDLAIADSDAADIAAFLFSR